MAYDFWHEESSYRDDDWSQRPWTDEDERLRTLGQMRCIYCANDLSVEHLYASESSRDTLELGACPACGWWRLYRIVVGGQDNTSHEIKVADAKVYDVGAIDAPLAELRQYLRTHPSNLAHINPFAFERLIGDCLRDEFTDCEVVHLGSSRGDGGIDLKLVRSDLEPILVQVKRRTDLSTAEGVRVVRELNGVLFREGTAQGMVVTTANRFTTGAVGEAAEVLTQAAAGHYHVDLRAFSDVVTMLNLKPRRQHRPWIGALNDYLAIRAGTGTGGIGAGIGEYLRNLGQQQDVGGQT
ncbi:restriction endonuclease [Mycobacterium avium]|uniref:restriction endonuclease n=1 Tax=Mycobacterium avium TaxID=1764 RepID=UPI0013039A55|nr:restriction endonuclease [Mycobacterium avium]